MSETEVAVEILNSRFDDLFNFGKGMYKAFDENKRVKTFQAYERYILNARSKLSKVKSFFVSDKPTGFYDYYAPLDISCGGTSLEGPGFLQCISSSERVVVIGTGGCGKSIFMRHIFLDCIKVGQYVPVFIELRDLNDSPRTLEEHIFYVLENGGFDVEGEIVSRSMKAGKFCFLFDGFDELVEGRRREVGGYIKEISSRFSGCPVITSSRPDEIFKGWNQFSVFCVEPLSKGTAASLVDKLPVDEEVKRRFLKELDERLYEEHKSFLSNPLLLSIMLLTYHQNADVPRKLSLFYSQAYEALFQRHDAAKGAYSRERATDLDILDFSKVFSLFSLITYDKRLFRMSKVDCLDYIERSKANLDLKLDFDRNDFLKDLLGSTCLLVEDGLQVAYSHRSFQEYFVSLYIVREEPGVQAELLSRYWDPSGDEKIVALSYEQNSAVVERGLLIPYLEKTFNALGVDSEITPAHHYEYICQTYDFMMLDSRGMAFFHVNDKSSVNRVAHGIVSTANRICGSWDFPPLEVYKTLESKVRDGFGCRDRDFHIKVRDIKFDSDVFRLLRDSNTPYGISYLKAAFELYVKLKEKHSGHAKGLFDLLGGRREF